MAYAIMSGEPGLRGAEPKSGFHKTWQQKRAMKRYKHQNITHTVISRTDDRIISFFFKKEAYLRCVDILFLREKSRRRGNGLVSTPPRRLKVAKRREEETRYVYVTRLVGLVNRDLFFQIYFRPFELSPYGWCCTDSSVPPTPPALFSEIRILVHHPFKAALGHEICRTQWLQFRLRGN
uniref:Uncharacterized protein n=1 Tax=Ixodes ricinus TaxID=34613 RepID=A0A6B0UYW3_IXORI